MIILHCLVFKEQSCEALLSKCLSLQATHLSYHYQICLSRTFLKFFSKLFGTLQRLASQGFATLFCVRVCQRLVIYYTSYKHMSTPFLKKMQKKSRKRGKCFMITGLPLAAQSSRHRDAGGNVLAVLPGPAGMIPFHN